MYFLLDRTETHALSSICKKIHEQLRKGAFEKLGWHVNTYHDITSISKWDKVKVQDAGPQDVVDHWATQLEIHTPLWKSLIWGSK